MRALASRLLLVTAMAGCELQEVTVVEFADVVVGEVYVTLGDVPGDHRVRAFLHGTTAGGAPDSETFNDAEIVLERGRPCRDPCLGLRPDALDLGIAPRADRRDVLLGAALEGGGLVDGALSVDDLRGLLEA